MSLKVAALMALNDGTRGPVARFFDSLTASLAKLEAGSTIVRAVATDNIADLTAASTTVDGVSVGEGDLILLPLQTTATENGVYRVGAVTAGTAPLRRVAGMQSGRKIAAGTVIEVGQEGVLYAGSTWKALTVTPNAKYGTTDPEFYPRTCRFNDAQLTNGVCTITGLGSGLWLGRGATVNATYNTPNTITVSVALKCADADRSGSKADSANIVVKAVKADSTTNAADQSTVDVLVTNW